LRYSQNLAGILMIYRHSFSVSSKIHKNVIFKLLLSVKAKVNALDNRDNTALSLAARHGATHIVKSLLSAQADVHADDLQCRTALDWAEQFGEESCVDALRAASASK